MRCKHNEATFHLIRALAAEQVSQCKPHSLGWFVACVNCGPQSNVSYADAPQYSATETEACAMVEALDPR